MSKHLSQFDILKATDPNAAFKKAASLSGADLDAFLKTPTTPKRERVGSLVTGQPIFRYVDPTTGKIKTGEPEGFGAADATRVREETRSRFQGLLDIIDVLNL